MVGYGIWWWQDLVKMVVEHWELLWDVEILVEFSIPPKFHSENNILQLKKYYAHYLHPTGEQKA